MLTDLKLLPSKNLKYVFLEFAMPSCKWGKVTCLQCKSYKFGPMVWDTTCIVIPHVSLTLWYHMFVCFSYHIPLVHHKNKSHSLESRLWKDISTSNFTVKLLQQNIRVWPWGSTQNVSWQIDWFPDYHISVFDLIIN